MAIRIVKVKEGSTTKLVTGVEGSGRILSIRTIKPASFVGCHNRSKSVCLLLLANSQLSYEQGGVLSAKQLAELSGISYNSILASMPKWCRWGLVRRTPVKRYKVRSGFLYLITPKGKAWLDRHRSHMAAQLEAYDAQLRECRGYGIAETLVNSPGERSPHARTLEDDSDNYSEDEEEDY